MVWQTPVRHSRAGESRASSFLTTSAFLSGPLPALLARRHSYSCYQLFLSVSFSPADENREERTLHCAELLSLYPEEIKRCRAIPTIPAGTSGQKTARQPQINHAEDAQTSGVAIHTIASPTISFLTFTSAEVTFPKVSLHPPSPCSPPSCW